MHLWFQKGGWASKKARQKLLELAPEQVKSVAVIRHAALGDMLLTRPFLLECRRFFPNANITLSVTSNYQRGAPDDLVDRIHVVYGNDQKGHSVREQFRRYRELGQQDIIFDLASTSRSAWTCLLNNADIKMGFPFRVFQRYLLYNVCVPRSDLRYEPDNMMDMLNAMGAKTAWPLDFALDVRPDKYEREFILFFPSASTPKRCWEHSRVAEAAGQLAALYPQLDIYLLEGRAEWEKVDSILAELDQHDAIYAKQCNDYDETLKLLASAKLVVSNDTGIRHMAVALGVPTVCIHHDESGTKSVPFRYWPRYPIHDVVFRTDGRQPEVSAVVKSITGILEQVIK